MKRPGRKFFAAIIRMGALGGVLTILLTSAVFPQAVPYARSFSKSAEEVECALKDLQAYSGQKLPIVDGFVATGDKPLNQYERAFYQFSIDVLPGASSGTIVRVTAKITAWYADKDPAKSGYQVLPSNGRLELDLFDRLEEKFGGKPGSSMARALSNSTISAPKPKLDLGAVPGVQIPTAANPAAKSGSTADELGSLRSNREAEEKHIRAKSDVVALLLTQGDRWCQWLEGLPESLLSEHVRQPGGALKTRFEMLVGTKEHEMHHRGQLMVIERLLGIVPHLTRSRQSRQVALR